MKRTKLKIAYRDQSHHEPVYDTMVLPDDLLKYPEQLRQLYSFLLRFLGDQGLDIAIYFDQRSEWEIAWDALMVIREGSLPVYPQELDILQSYLREREDPDS